MTAKKPGVKIAGGVEVRPNTHVYCVDLKTRSIFVGRVQKWDVGMVIVFAATSKNSMGVKYNAEDVFSTRQAAVDVILDKFGVYVP